MSGDKEWVIFLKLKKVKLTNMLIYIKTSHVLHI